MNSSFFICLANFVRMNPRIALVLLLFSCSSNTPETSVSGFAGPRDLALIDERLPEASGLVSSVVNEGYLWVLNDGQNPAEVYLIDTTANIKMTCKLPVQNRD